MYLARSRKTKGGALVETVAGLFILVPLVLFMIDGIAMVLAQTQNDALAKKCARAAASETDFTKATTAVANVIATFSSPIISGITADITDPANNAGFTASSTVTVQTRMTFSFPVPVPFLGMESQDFVADATEPIVGKLPS